MSEFSAKNTLFDKLDAFIVKGDTDSELDDQVRLTCSKYIQQKCTEKLS